MKLATFRDTSRDGALAVVSRKLAKAVLADAAAVGLKTLQQVMDDWETTQPKVARIYAELNKYTALRKVRSVETIQEGKPRTSRALWIPPFSRRRSKRHRPPPVQASAGMTLKEHR